MADLFSSPWAAVSASRKPTEEEELLGSIAQRGAEAIKAGAVNPAKAAAVGQRVLKNKAAIAKILQAEADGPGTAPMGATSPAAAKAVQAEAKTPIDPDNLMGSIGQFTGGGPSAREFKLDDQTQNELAIRKALTKAMNVDYTPEEMAEKYKTAMASPGIQAQVQGIEDMKGMLEGMPMVPAQPALHGLGDLANYATKGRYKMTGGAGAPGGLGPAAQQILNYYTKIQDDTRDVSKSAMEMIRGQKAGTTTVQDIENTRFLEKKLVELMQKQAPRPGGSGGNPANHASRYLKDFRSDPTVSEATKALNASRQFTQEFGEKATGNWVNDNALRASLIQAAKLYPVSDRDAAMFQGGPGIVERFNATVARAVDNQGFAPEDRKVVLDYMKLHSNINDRIISQQKESYANSMGPEYGYDRVRARKLLDSAAVSSQTGAEKTSANPPPAAEKVKVQKDGKQFMLPKAQLEKALKQGYTEVK